MSVVEYADNWVVEDAAVSAARTRGSELVPAIPSPTTCSVLRTMAQSIKAEAVVQAGSDSGVSGLYLLAGMADSGVLTSIEPHPDADRLSRETFRAARFGTRVRPISGDPLDVIGRLADNAYDMVVVGAGLGAPAPFLAEARRLLKPGGVAVVLRALGSDAVITDETKRDEATVAWRHTLNEISEDPTVVATLLPIDGGVLIVQLPK